MTSAPQAIGRVRAVTLSGRGTSLGHQGSGRFGGDRGIAAVGVGADRRPNSSFSGAPPTSTM